MKKGLNIAFANKSVGMPLNYNGKQPDKRQKCCKIAKKRDYLAVLPR
jgi:hypothetical protein